MNKVILGVVVVISIFILAVMWLFAGFVVNISSVSPWLSWMQWFSAFRYASNVLLINEFKGLSFCKADMSSMCPITGEYVLDKQSIDYATAWDLWKYFLGLTLMTVTFLTLAFIQLLCVKKRQ